MAFRRVDIFDRGRGRAESSGSLGILAMHQGVGFATPVLGVLLLWIM